jgi:hypothetical protein
LHGQRQVGNFVQKDGAALRAHKQAGVVAHRAGEGALDVAEQLRLDQVLRNRTAVHRHQRLAPARAGGVDGARQQLLAGAAVAMDQH